LAAVSVDVCVTFPCPFAFSVAANAKLWSSAQTRSCVSVSGGAVADSHECFGVGP